MAKFKITLETLKGMLKDKKQQIQNEPYCELWLDEATQLTRAIELVEMESEASNA